jgi:DNA repair protein RecN (Recombination protein N)
VSGLDLGGFFEKQELEVTSQLVIRRELSADGKSRSFVNEGLINLSALKELSEHLVDIHSQHQTLLINASDFQVGLVDVYAGSSALAQTYSEHYRSLNKIKTHIARLQEEEQKGRKELDYLQFQFNELEDASLKPGELEKLEEESLALENAETIRSGLWEIAGRLSDGEGSALTMLAANKNILSGLGRFGKNYSSLSERFNSIFIELKDLSSEISDEAEKVNIDEERLNIVIEKVDAVNRLLRKHNLKTEDELLALKEAISVQLQTFGSLEHEIAKLQKELDKTIKSCEVAADQLSNQRKKNLSSLEKEVKTLLKELSLENAEFRIELSRSQEFGPNGFDKLRFLFSANKGVPVNELQKVASGGELSRLMLCLKAILAGRKKLPTIIFDEIDTGVSGEVADRIGKILSNMGTEMQVITITHLPQMASKGTHHLFVYKKDNEDSTASEIRPLTKEERITEIAKMLSTGSPSQSALKNAKELLSLN